MIKNLFLSKSIMKIFAFTLFVLYMNVNSQSIPPNTRLMQLSTVKGGSLSIVESTENFIYHVGTSNLGEIGIDGLSSTSIGLEDLYILKSNVASGSNLWLKTFNAGNKGIIIPKQIYTDVSQNLYIFAQFSGSINVGNTTLTSGINANAFLLKLDSSGNALWINSFVTTNISSHPCIKFASDTNDLFMIYNQNHLVRINNLMGNIIYDNVYSSATDFRGIALKNDNIYVAGFSTSETFGTETVTNGFIIKGDKTANFNASMQITGGAIAGADVSDIAFATDGNLLLTGFNSSSISLQTESGTSTYTYNPNASFANNRIYHYTAKTDPNLSTVSFFRTSTPISSDAAYRIEFRNFSAKLIPYGTAGNFKTLVSLGFYNGRNSLTDFIAPNSSSIAVANTGTGVYHFLSSSNNIGVFDGFFQPQLGGLNTPILTSNGNYYSQTVRNSRLFTSTVYNSSTGATIWTKQKSSSVGGRLSTSYQHHLNSAKSDMFFTTLVEGKSNFFNRQVNNTPGVYSRYVTRLGVDGLTKWVGRFHPDAGIKELNPSNDHACVDSNDNFIFLANTSGATSTFIDASGNFTDFNQNAALSAKALIKLDKNGNLLWSKQIVPVQSAKINAAVITDGIGNVYVVGTTTNNFNIDGTTVTTMDGNNIFLLKFSATGVLQYAKSYQKVGAYSLLPVFDAQNNMYLFTEPINTQDSNYVFDGITVPSNPDRLDHLMLKFNNSGDVVFGKNFYANLPQSSSGYSWPNDVIFDGADFIIMGNYYDFSSSNSSSNYNGLDLTPITKVYSTEKYIPFFAKVKTDGNVVWQKPINANAVMESYTNIDIDENKNIYMYWYIKDKMSLNGTEYSFDTNAGSKILTKLDTDGILKYNKVVDVNPMSYPMIDVFGDDKVNVSSFTSSNNILNYPVNYNRASNLYIATFGNLDIKYLTPTKDYLLLNNIEMDNNPDNANTFTFDLINNVNWSANSDQNWLNLSFESLTGKYEYKNLISGSGDTKIIMSALTNNTGVDRTANVMISGDSGVSPKTIAITQSAVLASGETQTFITTLYPNPTSDILNIETQQKISKIEIFDVSGKLLKMENGKDKKVSVSQLAKGMYIIKLYTEKGVINSKFIKN